MSYEFVCSEGSQKNFSLHAANKEEIESEKPGTQNTPTQTGRDLPIQTGDDSAPSKREITSLIERLELLEEKFGIVISGLYASCKFEKYGPYQALKINFDVTSLNGGKIEHSLFIRASAYNATGQLLDSPSIYISSADFMGFVSESISCNLDQVPAKIRLFPSGR